MRRTWRCAWACACAIATGCAGAPPEGTPNAEHLAFFENNSSVAGMDGGYSIIRSDGTALWLFGDTLLGRWCGAQRSITGGISNSAAVVSPQDVRDRYAGTTFVGGDPAIEVITAPDHPSNLRRWPGDGVEIDGVVWLYYVVAGTSSEGLGFEVVGHGVARGSGEPPTFAASGDLLWEPSAPAFGTSVLVVGDQLYVFGVRVPDDGSVRMDVFLARAIVGSALDSTSSYEYFTAKGEWSSDPAQVAPLMAGGSEMTVRYNAFLDSYVALYIPPFGSTIEMRTAKEPWGPWSDARTVARCDLPDLPGVFCSGAKQHVELDREEGREVVITYNTNFYKDQISMLKSHPTIYWPVIMDITLPETL